MIWAGLGVHVSTLQPEPYNSFNYYNLAFYNLTSYFWRFDKVLQKFSESGFGYTLKSSRIQFRSEFPDSGIKILTKV